MPEQHSDVVRITEQIAADFGNDVASETDALLTGYSTRFGFMESVEIASLIVSATQLALQLWSERSNLAEVFEALALKAQHFQKVDPAKRLAVVSKVANTVAFSSSAQNADAPLSPTRFMARCLDGELVRGRFNGPVYFAPFACMEYFYVLRPFHWKPDPGLDFGAVPVEVPAGFVTDLASVPRPFWSIVAPIGRHGQAAIMHDWLYWQQTSSREVADEAFNAIMRDLNVSHVSRNLIVSAVMAFGKAAWENNRALKEAGGRRILKELPAEATITWNEWKSQPQVFQ